MNLVFAVLIACPFAGILDAQDTAHRKPNFVYILADDLGYGELGCYGQTKIKTPNLDRLAADGLRFTQHYSGSPVCAPSRCTLMTGLHTGHAYVRGNRGRPVVGQLPIPADTVTLPKLLKKLGYTTGCMGKWGLGGPDTTGLPNRQGFDHWFGYLDQWNAHSHYPAYLWRNLEKVPLPGNANGKQEQYSQDRITAEALRFIRERRPDEPFFLYVPYAVPHVSLHVPETSLAAYRGKWPETPYKGGHYAGHKTPRAAYAAMISHLDRDIGKILAALEERGFAENTIVMFSSDNGPTYAGGVDARFFNSAGPLRGLKGSVYEGGIRVPLIARWPAKIRPGATTDHVSAFWDVLPTLVELAGGKPPEKIDGLSFAPTLLGRDGQKQHDHLYWEHHTGGILQAVRFGDWKAVRKRVRFGDRRVELYDLKKDIAEQHDVAADHPEIARRALERMESAHEPSELFPFEPAIGSWPRKTDRVWVGPQFWANRLQDWRVRNGRLECVADRFRLPMRTVHLLTRAALTANRPFTLRVRLGLVRGRSQPVNPEAAAGFLVGVGANMYGRAAALVHGVPGPGAGIFAGVTARGELFFRDNEKTSGEQGIKNTEGVYVTPASLRPDDVALRLEVITNDVGPAQCRLSLRHAFTDVRYAETTVVLDAARLQGHLALVCHPGRKAAGGRPGRFWFREWRVFGKAIDSIFGSRFGPIVCAQHTLSRGVLKLTAQLAPVGKDEVKEVRFQAHEQGHWKTVAKSPIVRPGFTATFRVPGWDATRDTRYRVACDLPRPEFRRRTHTFEGIIRRDPVDQETLVVAGFTGNHNCSHRINRAPFDWTHGIWFPHPDIDLQVRLPHVDIDLTDRYRPDVLFFSGDQVYEGASPTFADRRHLELDYLYKWYLWCWAFRDLTRSIPCVTIPDDHDVYQGNLWGEGGRPARRDHDGGYVHPAWFVKMVERTQTSHLPDPYDPTPIEQGIGVYYTSLTYGRISFAILEDRKFKSGPAGRLPPTGTRRPDHVTDPEFDVKKADVPGLKLLGDRQLRFLEAWAQDWRGADMKVALSQTTFANLATHHGPDLRYLRADLDSNGWPQTGRNKALHALRRAFAFHLCGDQHLATLVQHGINAPGDAIWAFCVPSIANFYPRKWFPFAEGLNRAPGAPTWTGDHFDGLGNRVTVYAATNPGPKSGIEPADLHDKMPGYGMVRLNKEERTITVECWPRHADRGDPKARQYEGWPRTIKQTDNYARKAAAYLPTIEVRGLIDPVIRVVDESSGELVYAIRILGHSMRPKVFRPGRYTVMVGDPDAGKTRTLTGVDSLPPSEARSVVVEFSD